MIASPLARWGSSSCGRRVSPNDRRDPKRGTESTTSTEVQFSCAGFLSVRSHSPVVARSEVRASKGFWPRCES